MQNRGILITLRAAAIVIIATGLNDVVAGALPRYEPLYLYLAAIALVSLLDGVILGVATAMLSIAFYALLFMTRADAFSPRIAIPAVAALGVAIVVSTARGLIRSRRRRRPETLVPSMPPLLETSAVAKVADNAEVLAAIDELRAELRAAVAELTVARSREDELQERARSHSAERELIELRARQLENERDWALKVAEESRARADRERSLRTAAEDLLAETRDESATMAGRQAELELSLHEAERTRSELTARVAELERALAEAQTHVADLERALTEQRATRQRLEQERTASTSRIAELENALARERATREESTARIAGLERTSAETAAAAASRVARIAELERELDEARGLRARITELEGAVARVAELEVALAAERATREQLEAEAGQFDKKLQTIVTHLASDHETDLGQALSDKEEARAEARSLSMKLTALQRKFDEERAAREAVEALLTETRNAAQAEINRLRAATAAPHPATPRPRILIVHPDADLRGNASATLERAGYEVVGAADGLEALRVAIARQPEVVIAEGSMPKMDGRELCQLLKSQEKTAHIRVILLMRASDEAPRGQLTPDEVLRKPVPVETLKSTLANLLSSNEQRVTSNE